MKTESQSLGRGLDILMLIDTSPVPMGVREIARHLNLSSAIVQRLLNTLLSYGFVEQEPSTRRYRIGHQSMVLGASNRNADGLIRSAHDVLRARAEDEGLNGYLGAVSGDRGIYLLSVPSRRIILRVDAGEPLAMHCTALGKILLASVPTSRALQLLGSGPLPKKTEHTIDDAQIVLAQLDQIRAAGYAQVREENLPGVISVAAPIANETGAIVAGISLAYAAGTISCSHERVIELAVAAAHEVSLGLGCPVALLDRWRNKPEI
ncbi:IclR family transcriptional regulator [Mesorhizobium sp. BAC0120]|uniref:IclR family transcriptional regulator n=1 Tax=Mesorhizobium sp. BAC0120 TaxID=3090670 RepID=UPI00298C60DA|nr:IclR family transcriptional regulator [Mesorhizobium sp. BAC0120]MDW6023290.1 IclR family transcriptional regulator [Mesorhizobium sp. BAC0120]